MTRARGTPWFIALAGVLFCLATTRAGVQDAAYPELRPIDEASQQPDFFTFRAHLQSAIARRDAAAVLATVHADIRNTFGDDNGRDAFVRLWRPDAADSELWSELGTVLALGGTFDQEGAFVAPYTFSRWPGAFDSFEHVAVLGSNVRVRAAPAADAQPLTAVSFAILPLARAASQTGDAWTSVRLRGGQTGFVASQYVRSPIDYRAIFRRSGGRWLMMTFIAGD